MITHKMASLRHQVNVTACTGTCLQEVVSRPFEVSVVKIDVTLFEDVSSALIAMDVELVEVARDGRNVTVTLTV